MTEINLPIWVQIVVSVLVLAGTLVTLIGALSLFRLPSYYERVHTPSIIACAGCWLIVWSSVLFFSLQSHKPSFHTLLIAVLLSVAVPITNIFLMRAALFRDRRMGKDVPPSLSRIVSASPDANDA
ncbi:monovalent cation/H(+) antiporter subunit G [Comamonas piscis]|uniref:Monovalent cation/H(+) antiporter subunit G n=1 Tax=Comamonas piscis TaxID=1562974 RepID=A0A7G5EI18_9BURK|nr:monovalent cation/H(+) antiporter subunit G [Comamonas piscis]QMV73643.1 monovalent cation/H(+) antiporter subunit G [Comamonas piscis]WSO32066.1 monovalent cation/H(+) antiporter subunit G [Comamonas piscis]